MKCYVLKKKLINKIIFMKHNYDSVDMLKETCSTNSTKQKEASYTVKERTWLSFIAVFLMSQMKMQKNGEK